MKVFLIILAVLIVIIALILSLSADITLIYDKGWHTTIRVLFIEKEIELSKILSFVLFPEKAASDVAKERKEEKTQSKNKKHTENKEKKSVDKETADENNAEPSKEKPNYIKQIWDKDGLVGIMLLISNLLQTVNSAVTTLFKGLHIYSLYVKMIIGGSDAADIADTYGTICGVYYPIKGIILNGMKVDNYDDYIQPDFIAPNSEYEFQLIAGLNVALILKIALKAGKVFVVNLIKNK